EKTANIEVHDMFKRDFYSIFLKGISSLSIVLGAIFLTLFVWKRLLAFQGRGIRKDTGLIRILATHYFSPQQSIALVEINGEQMVLGITPDRISVLTNSKKSNDFKDTLNQETDKIEETAKVLRGKFVKLEEV
ncbi:MAG: flagellar biosynthetic protein FliO, partial [Deltaproteobacteria bacterium]|nr:flagellar biosynthetic protein FliO [Deltaproteobacteria bacterium]